MSRYGLFGSLRAHPGKRDELLALLLEAANSMTGTPGCDVWVVSVSPDDDDKVWIMEAWVSEADHAASLKDGRTRAVIEKAMPLIAGMDDRVVLEPLGGKGLSQEA